MLRLNQTRKAALVASILMAAGLLASCDSAEERADKHYHNGTVLMAEGDPIKASLEFRNALKLREDFIEALFALAEAQESLEHLGDAVQAYLSVATQVPEHVEARVRLAIILASAGSPDEARRFADEAYALSPDDVNVLVAKAAVALKLDNRGDAVRLSQAALENDPHNADALIILASERLKDGDARGALTLIDRGLQKNPRSLGLQYLKVNSLDAVGDLEGVEAALRQLVDDNPQDAPFRTGLASLYVQQGRLDHAETLLRDRVTAQPDDAAAQLELVAFLKANRGLAAARRELDALIVKDPEQFSYRMALAEILLAGDDDSGATDLLNDVIASDRGHEEQNQARLQLSRVLASGGDQQESLALVDAILNDDAKNVGALEIKSRLYLANGQTREAISYLLALINEAPDSGNARLLLAEAYERLGSVELAEEQYARAVGVDAWREEASRRMARFLLRYGKIDKAIGVLEQAPAGDWQALRQLANLKLNRRDFAGAYEAASGIRPTDGPADIETEMIKVAALAGLGRQEEAIDILGASLARAGDSPTALLQLANGYASVGKTDEAEAVLAKVSGAAPADPRAYVLMGLIRERAGRAEKAEDAFRQAVAADPSDRSGHEALVGFLMRQGRLADAKTAARQGLDETDEPFNLRIQFALLLDRTGHIEAAIDEYEALFASNPRSSLIANNLAVNLSKISDDPEALDRAYEIAARFRTSHIPHFVDTLGWIEYLRGNHESALPLLRNAAGQLSEVAQVQFHYGMVLKAMGQNDQATEVLTRAIALAPPQSPLADQAGQALGELGSGPKTTARVNASVQTEIVSQTPHLSSGRNEPGL